MAPKIIVLRFGKAGNIISVFSSQASVRSQPSFSPHRDSPGLQLMKRHGFGSCSVAGDIESRIGKGIGERVNAFRAETVHRKKRIGELMN